MPTGAVTYVELLSQTRGHSLVLGLTLFLYKHGPPSDALSPLETFIESEVKNDILILKNDNQSLLTIVMSSCDLLIHSVTLDRFRKLHLISGVS